MDEKELVHFVLSGKSERYRNERSVDTRVKRMPILATSNNVFRHELQTVLFRNTCIMNFNYYFQSNEKLRVKEINRKWQH